MDRVKLKYLIASNRVWNVKMAERLMARTGHDFILVSKKDELTKVKLEKINPKFIFFPHWSYYIPADIYKNFECIVFHMTDLPFGRGGSPLQNLIERGIYDTKISALRCSKEIDAGDVYMKRDLSLYGSAEEIYIRANIIMEEMIAEIVLCEPHPVPQSGEIVSFSRRGPDQSNIEELSSLDKVFDYIRMLDAEDYPKAFIETKHLKLEFSRACMKNECIISDVKITLKNKTKEST